MLSHYIEFVDIFLDDVYATFILSEITKGEYWRELAPSQDSQFLHAYFHFLEQAMWASARYAIFLDDSSSKRYKFKSMHYSMNMPYIGRQKKVHTFGLVQSHDHNVMQLVDVILGALTSTAEASHKGTLAGHVRQKIAVNTKYGRPKLMRYAWTPPRKRRFVPHF